jgi:hypothetical protein
MWENSSRTVLVGCVAIGSTEQISHVQPHTHYNGGRKAAVLGG